MSWWLKTYKSHEYEMIFIFANTGKEREETLRFVQRCDKAWGLNVVWVEAVTVKQNMYGVRARVVDFDTANRDGRVFEEMIQKHGLPNATTPHCSRQLKRETIKAYLRTIGWRGKNYQTAIGIRSDEPQRINRKQAKRHRLVYPLHDWMRTNRSDVNFFWSKQPFDLELKSYEGNCDLCWKKSRRKLLTLLAENPERAEWWAGMERLYENFVPESRSNANITLPLRMYRENTSVKDLLREAEGGKFLPAVDEGKDFDLWKQLSFAEMLDMYDPDLDVQDGGCSESCEPF